MSEERKQGEAILIAAVAICFWVSHYIAIHFKNLYGNFDLQQWLRFWNKQLLINWPAAAILFVIGYFLGRQILRQMRVYQLRMNQDKARRLLNQTMKKDDSKQYRPIL